MNQAIVKHKFCKTIKLFTLLFQSVLTDRRCSDQLSRLGVFGNFYWIFQCDVLSGFTCSYTVRCIFTLLPFASIETKNGIMRYVVLLKWV